MNYGATTKDGRKLRSTTIFIRDPKSKKLVGAVCINIDLTDYEKMEKIWEDFCHTTPLSEQIDQETKAGGLSETFARSPQELLEEAIERAVDNMGRSLSSVNKDDRIKLIQLLDKGGIFLIKGAVDEIARRLEVSRYTIYNYLKESKFKKAKDII